MASSLPKARRIIAKAREAGCDFFITVDDHGKPDLAFGPNNKTDEQQSLITDLVLIAMAMPRLNAAIIQAAIENEQSAARAS